MTRFQVIPAVYLLLFRNSKREILLGARKGTPYFEGFYGLPSGHLELGESLTDGLLREVREETGIEINKTDLSLVHSSWRETILSNPGTRIDFFFECSKFGNQIVNTEPSKCNGWEWVSVDNLPSKTIPFVKSVIKDFLNGSRLSEYYKEDRLKLNE